MTKTIPNLHGETAPFIVKVQWPLTTTREHLEKDLGVNLEAVLVYNEDRSIFQMFPATRQLARTIGVPKKVKGYFYATIKEPEQVLVLGEKAPDQNW